MIERLNELLAVARRLGRAVTVSKSSKGLLIVELQSLGRFELAADGRCWREIIGVERVESPNSAWLSGLCRGDKRDDAGNLVRGTGSCLPQCS